MSLIRAISQIIEPITQSVIGWFQDPMICHVSPGPHHPNIQD